MADNADDKINSHEVERIKELYLAEAVPTDAKTERKLNAKIDIRLIPTFFVLMIVGYIDRINIGNARIMGLEKDLGMTGSDFNVALFVVFIGYITCEVPCNLILVKFRPSTWIASLTLAWGFITICQGLTRSFAGLVVCRILIGVFEAGFFPGMVYICSSYYTKYEFQARMNLMFGGSTCSGAFSGLIAYAVSHMKNVRGYGPWRWLFIIEGCATCVIAIAAYFLIPDWPENAKFLSQEEKGRVVARIQAETGLARMDHLNRSAVKLILSDPKIYLCVLMYIAFATSGYTVSLFTPTLINGYGASPLRTQVLSIPIYLVSATISVLVAFISDKSKHRFGFIVGSQLLIIISYAVFLRSKTIPFGAKYFALFLIACGAFTGLPLCIGWLNNNTAGRYKRSVASAMTIGFGNIGGLVASNVFLKKEAPVYKTGFSCGLAFVCLGLAAAVGFLMVCMVENKKRDAGGRDHRLQLPADEVNNLGDAHPSWRYHY